MADRKYFLGLSGSKIAIAADVLLGDRPDREAILLDGKRLGMIVAETAKWQNTTLALPHMDLRLEKRTLLQLLGIEEDPDTYLFSSWPGDELAARLDDHLEDSLDPHLQAQVDAVHFISAQTDLVPVGMVIGPFSLMATKLLGQAIQSVYTAATDRLAGSKDTAAVKTVEGFLELGLKVILRSVKAQLEAGAKAIFVAEPAGCCFYISPLLLKRGSDVFDRYVIAANRRIAELARSYGAELLYHCCGELDRDGRMLGKFVELDPAILSLGSSVDLASASRAVPNTIVLFGNIPSKRFALTEYGVSAVAADANALFERMQQTGHPFILGSECDVLDVPEMHGDVKAKTGAIFG